MQKVSGTENSTTKAREVCRCPKQVFDSLSLQLRRIMQSWMENGDPALAQDIPQEVTRGSKAGCIHSGHGFTCREPTQPKGLQYTSS